MFQHVFTTIIGSAMMRAVAFLQSLNLFCWPGFSIINTACILCYMKVSFRSFKIFWNTYFLNYLCQTWSHGWHRIDSSIALFWKSLTLSKVYAFILSTLLIVPIGFPRLGAVFYTQTAHDCTESQLYDVRPAWYVVPQCRPLDSGGLKGWMQFMCHRVIWGIIICCNSKQVAVSKFKMIQHAHQMYG